MGVLFYLFLLCFVFVFVWCFGVGSIVLVVRILNLGGIDSHLFLRGRDREVGVGVGGVQRHPSEARGRRGGYVFIQTD